MLAAKDTILQPYLFMSLRSLLTKRGFFFGGGCFVLGFLAVCGPEKILSLATPTLQSQPMRQSVADGACP